LYLLRVDGQEARLISRNIEGRIDAVTFSPDGNKLIWEETRKGEQYVYIANLDGSGMHEIFSNADLPSEYNITSNLLWSPDGTRIVYAGPPDKNFNYHLWVLTLGKATSITPTP
jgi:Tol biopolymer transport system component